MAAVERVRQRARIGHNLRPTHAREETAPTNAGWIKMRRIMWDAPGVERLCERSDQVQPMVIGGLDWMWIASDQRSKDAFLRGISHFCPSESAAWPAWRRAGGDGLDRSKQFTS